MLWEQAIQGHIDTVGHVIIASVPPPKSVNLEWVGLVGGTSWWKCCCLVIQRTACTRPNRLVGQEACWCGWVWARLRFHKGVQLVAVKSTLERCTFQCTCNSFHLSLAFAEVQGAALPELHHYLFTCSVSKLLHCVYRRQAPTCTPTHPQWWNWSCLVGKYSCCNIYCRRHTSFLC